MSDPDPRIDRCFEAITQLADLIKQQSQKSSQSAQDTSLTPISQSTAHKSSIPIDAIESRIQEFRYSPEEESTFELWWSRHEDIFKTDLAEWTDSQKVRLLLRHVTPSIEKTLCDSLAPKTWSEVSLEVVVAKMTTLFGDTTSIFDKRRSMLDIRMSTEGIEDVKVLAARVNRLVESAQMASIKPDELKCLVFLHALDLPRYSDIHLHLLKEARKTKATNDSPTTLDDLMSVYNNITQLKRDSKAVTEARVIHSVHANQNSQRSHQNPRKFSPRVSHQTKPQSYQPNPHSNQCFRCGSHDHTSKQCKHITSECNHCKRIGHLERICQSKKKGQSKGKHNRANLVMVATLSATDYTIQIQINDHSVPVQIDTGADISIISERTWKSMGSPPCSPTDIAPSCANGSSLSLLGKFNATIQYKGVTSTGPVYVTPTDILLLGKDHIVPLQLLTLRDHVPSVKAVNHCSLTSNNEYRDWITTEYPEVAKPGLGKCTKTSVSLQVKPNSKPVFIKARSVPYALLPKVEEELTRLQQIGAIKPIEYSKWAAPILVAPKPNGAIRMCTDFSTGLNNAIDLPAHPLPRADDIYASLNGCTIFTQIDLTEAYYQLELDESAKELLVMNTHKGLFQYQRMPFGVKAAPAIFQRVMDTMLSGVTNAIPYLDDIVIGGKSKEDHDSTLKEVFNRLRDYGLRTRIEKCNFGLERVKFLGFFIDKNGRHTDPSRTEAISTMPEPQNIMMLMSFLGMVTFYGSFISGMHKLRAPLDALLKKDSKWNWTTQCRDSFRELKTILSSVLSLVHFDPNKEIVVAADACDSGIGAVLMHRYPDGTLRAISHASRRLKPAEVNYGQIEKEALGLIYAVTKCHKFIYGRRFTLQTDHKPLLSIFGSTKGVPIYSAKRIYRWCLTLLAYDFNVEYINTHSFAYADALSRLISDRRSDDETSISIIQAEQDTMSTLKSSVRHLPITVVNIQNQSANDTVIQQVIQKHLNGWKSTDSKNPVLYPFYQRRLELAVINGCLMMGHRVIVPTSLRQRILKDLHQGHPGIVRMKSLARSVCYWPGLDSEIQSLVSSCDRCAKASKNPIKVPLQPWPDSSRPWERIHIDYAGPISGDYFLVIVDSFSKWPEIYINQRITAHHTVTSIRDLITRYGIPETIVSDNGTQFTSELFAHMCQEYGIKHITTAPYHPQSNGQAERFVDSLKRTIKKMDNELPNCKREVINTFLSTYRRLPNPNTTDGRSPSFHFLGREIRGKIDLIVPHSIPTSINQKIKDQFDSHHGTRDRSFSIGDHVFYRKQFGPNKFEWTPATITAKRGRVMFDITVNNKPQRAHKNQLKSRQSPFTAISHDQSTDDSLSILMDTFSMPVDDYAGTAPVSPIARLPPARPLSPDRGSTTVPRAPTPQKSPTRRQSPPRPVKSPRPIRARQPVVRLQPNPSKKSYV